MADWSFGVDTKEVDKLLNSCADPGMRLHLARSMSVAGAKVIVDEAVKRAPVYKPGVGRNGKKQRINAVSAANAGALRDAIYQAYRDQLSSANRVIYSVSWNSTKAPHGHLVEFGHWLVSGKGGNRRVIKWVPAYPFLRPAYDAKKKAAVAQMIKRGRERLPELLREGMK